jgi:hypothetical protein
MLAKIERRYYGFRTSTDITACVGICLSVKCGFEIVRVQMCIWLWTPYGWKIKFVSGNCERSM